MKNVLSFLFGACLLGGMVLGQEVEDDPFNDPEWLRQNLIAKAPESWEVMVEVFSVPFTEAAKLRREMQDAGKVYAELVKQVHNGKAKLEEFAILKGRVGVVGEMTSVEELIYPTAFEPPQLPNIVKKVPTNPEVAMLLMTPAHPSAFDSRNLGVTMGLERMVKVAPDAIELDLKLDRVSMVDLVNWGQGKANVGMPKFEVQTVDRKVTLISGKPSLLGTLSSPGNTMQAGEERRVCLAFATTKPAVR